MANLLRLFGLFDILAFFGPGFLLVVIGSSYAPIPNDGWIGLTIYYVFGAFVVGSANSQIGRFVELLLLKAHDCERVARAKIPSSAIALLENRLGVKVDSSIASKYVNTACSEAVLAHLDIHQRSHVFARNMLIPLAVLGAHLIVKDHPIVGIATPLLLLPLFVARYYRHKVKYISDAYWYGYLHLHKQGAAQ